MISAEEIRLFYFYPTVSTYRLIYSPKYILVQSSSMFASVELTVYVRLLHHEGLFKIPDVNCMQCFSKIPLVNWDESQKRVREG